MKWPTDVEEPKGNLLIYETEETKVQPDMLAEAAKRFEVKGDIQSRDDIYLVAQNKRALAMYRNSGAFWYADLSKLQRPDYKPELPSQDEAAKIAGEYLKRNDWLPAGATLEGVHQNIFETVEGKKHEKKGTQPNNICVDFRVSPNERKVYGPGAKIKLFLGHKGEVIGLFRDVRQFHKYSELPALSRKEVEEILRLKLRVPLKQIEIRAVKLANYAGSCVLRSQFVEPIYVFTLVAPIKSKRRREPTMVEFETHPLPATSFSPVVSIDAPDSLIESKQGETVKLSCTIRGGTPPYKFSWDSDLDGHLSDERVLVTRELSVAHRARYVTSHTIKATVTDGRGLEDLQQVLVRVLPREGISVRKKIGPTPGNPNDPYVGVEWCNIYHGSAADISGTDPSAKGFKDYVTSLPGWSSRFDWGNDSAWEEDFKLAGAPGGGTDSYWIDNVQFAFFAGHGSPGSFYFGSTVDDHEMRSADARWGDGALRWIVLHACETMRANFGWTVWCDAFKGLHQMFGFHTVTEGSTPPLGSRFAYWMTLHDMQTAWRLACMECFDSGTEYALIYAGQSGTDTYNDHLPGYGHVSADPTSPNYWVYYRGTC